MNNIAFYGYSPVASRYHRNKWDLISLELRGLSCVLCIPGNTYLSKLNFLFNPTGIFPSLRFKMLNLFLWRGLGKGGCHKVLSVGVNVLFPNRLLSLNESKRLLQCSPLPFLSFIAWTNVLINRPASRLLAHLFTEGKWPSALAWAGAHLFLPNCYF